jgi:hypothetical protein
MIIAYCVLDLTVTVNSISAASFLKEVYAAYGISA